METAMLERTERLEQQIPRLKLWLPQTFSYDDVRKYLAGDVFTVRELMHYRPRLELRLELMFVRQLVAEATEPGQRPSIPDMVRAAMIYRLLPYGYLLEAGLVAEHECEQNDDRLMMPDVVHLLQMVASLEIAGGAEAAESTVSGQVPPRCYVMHLLVLPDYVSLAYYRALGEKERVEFFHDILVSQTLWQDRLMRLNLSGAGFIRTYPSQALLKKMAEEPVPQILRFIGVARRRGMLHSRLVTRLLDEAFVAHSAEENAKIAVAVMKELARGYQPNADGVTDFDYRKFGEVLKILHRSGVLPFHRAYAIFHDFPARGLMRPEHDFCLEALTLARDAGGQAKILALAMIADCTYDTEKSGPAKHCWILLRAHGAVPLAVQRGALGTLEQYYNSRMNWEAHVMIGFIARVVLTDDGRIRDEMERAAQSVLASESQRPDDYADALQGRIVEWFWEWYRAQRGGFVC